MQKMKQYIRNIVAIAALLVTSLNARADGEVVIKQQIDGKEVTSGTAANIETYQSNGMCILTVTPNTGYYLKDIAAVRTISGTHGAGRTKAPNIDEGVIEITPSEDNPEDMSQTTTFSLVMPESPYDVEVTANFAVKPKEPQEAGLSFAQTSFEVELGTDFQAPTLENPNKLTVTWESSKPNVATVDGSGNVTILAVGSTTISAVFAGNDDYKAQTVSYTISVTKKESVKYDLWVGGTQVTEDNQNDIFGSGDKQEKVASSFSYNPKNQTLIISGNNDGLVIETGMKSGLTVYLAPNTSNTVSRIIYSGEGDAPLAIATDGNYPGQLTLDATATSNYVIEGFSTFRIDYMTLIEPEDISYANKMLATQKATIGQPIQPLTEETTVEPTAENFQTENEQGETEDVDLTNTVIEDILYTLNDTADPEGDGYDEDENCIVINSITTNEEVVKIVSNETTPGTTEFAEKFSGLTFMVPSGSGVIKLDVQTLNGHVLMVKIGNEQPIAFTKAERDIIEIPYETEKPAYVYVYNAGTATTARGIFPGKKTAAHVKVFSVTVTPSNVTSTNNVRDVSGDQYTGDTSTMKGQELNPEYDPTAIQTLQPRSKDADSWYDLQGRRITSPKKAGIYIRNGKKTIVK